MPEMTMSVFVRSLRAFGKGEISLEQLFEVTDKTLARAETEVASMLSILTEEYTRGSIPLEVYQVLTRDVKLSLKSTEGSTCNASLQEDTVVDGKSELDDDTDVDLALRELHDTGTFSHGLGESIALASAKNHPLEPGKDAQIKTKGETLNGRYKLEEYIGSGGMNTVYKALDLQKQDAGEQNPYVAVKLLDPKFSIHKDWFVLLQQEAKRCQELTHPNIVKVYDFDRDGNTVYLTMEYLPGESLKEKIGTPDFSGLSIQQALPIVNGMGKALAYAHGRGVVHSDFKPANVILSHSGEVKVIDFGLARAIREDEKSAIHPSLKNAGTPSYASPESLEHQNADPRDDVFALACTTFELLTGHHPFNRIPTTEARDARLSPMRPLGLGNRQWEALHSALIFNRDERTSKVEQFLKDFNAKGNLWRTRYLVATVATAAVLMALGGGYYIGRHSYLGQESSPSNQFNLQSQPGLGYEVLEAQEKPAALVVQAPEVAPLASNKVLDDSLEVVEFSAIADRGAVRDSARREAPKQADGDMSASAQKQSETVAILEKRPKPLYGLQQQRLFISSQRGDPSVVKSMLAAGISPNVREHASGLSALMIASKQGHLAVMKVLIEAGAAIDATDQNRMTSLLWATKKGHAEAVKLLIANGTDINAVDGSGASALTLAARGGNEAIVRLLIDNDIDLDIQNNDGWPALISAAVNGHVTIVRLLLAAGANPKLTAWDGRTALMAAAWNGYPKIARYLCATDSIVNMQDNNGWTALISAAWNGHRDIVETLMASGADLNIKNKRNETALMVAKKQGHQEIVALLGAAMNK